MAISYGGKATGADNNSTSVGTPYPASIAAGDLLVLITAVKYPTTVVNTPSGWYAPSGNTAQGGAGASGAGTGQVTGQVFFKVATGAETGNLVLSVTGTVNSLTTVMYRFTKTSTKKWGITIDSGTDSTAGATWSATASSVMSLQTNDYLLAISAVCTVVIDGNTPTLSATGVTMTSTTRAGRTNIQGDDVSVYLATGSAVSGLATTAPNLSITWTAASATTAAGVTLFVVLREEPEVAITTTSTVVDTPIEKPSVVISSSSLVIDNPIEKPTVSISSSSLVVDTPIEQVSTTIQSGSVIMIEPIEALDLSINTLSTVEADVELIASLTVSTESIVQLDPLIEQVLAILTETGVDIAPIQQVLVEVLTNSIVYAEPVLISMEAATPLRIRVEFTGLNMTVSIERAKIHEEIEELHIHGEV